MSEKFDERRVRYLYESVGFGSIRAAAEKLGMNPSVISRQIAQLEADLAIPLLDRHGRGVKPTEAGQLLVDYFRQYRSNQQDIVAKIDEIRGIARGHVDLVLGEGFVSDLMGDPLRAFWERYPNIGVSIKLAGTTEVMRTVIEDESHLGLVYNPPVLPGIRSRAASRQPMCAIVLPDHPFANSRSEPVLKDLLDYPLALMRSAFGTRQILEAAEHNDKIRLTPHLTTDSISVLKHYVRDGHGITVLPAFAIAQEIEQRVLVAVPINNEILNRPEAHLITRLGRQLAPAANQLLNQLLATMRALKRPA